MYTKFASLISSDPIIQTLLPLTPAGEICDIDGNCVDPQEDELFKLTTKDGTLTLEREKVYTAALVPPLLLQPLTNTHAALQFRYLYSL